MRFQEPQTAYLGKYAEEVKAVKERPNEWLLLWERDSHRAAPRVFRGAEYARAYRREKVEGRMKYRTFVKFVGE